jgi:hypothetical protein
MLPALPTEVVPVPPLATGRLATVLRLPLASLTTMPAVVRPLKVSPLKLGLATVLKEPQVPPLPRVIVLPPPVRLPVPEGHVRVVLPATAVAAVEP